MPLNVNMAACHLKLKQWGDVKKTCGKALEMESANVKALFRRAQVGHRRVYERRQKKHVVVWGVAGRARDARVWRG